MIDSERDEFFVGYLSPMPSRLARFVTRAIVVLAISLTLWAAVVASSHVRLDAGTFEFGHPMSFAGTIVERPYPAIRLDHDDGAETPTSLLVASGKHGADVFVRGLDGRHVTVIGTRIQRSGHLMIEVDSVEPSASDQPATPVLADSVEELAGDPIELTGEIVDSKCFLGVMVPGSGKTHKECASLCIRGGIPPALFVQDRRGQSALLLLSDSNDKSIAVRATETAGQAITMTGIVHREKGWLVLHTDPATWRLPSR